MRISSGAARLAGRKALIVAATVVGIILVAAVCAAAFIAENERREACEAVGGKWITETDYVPVTQYDSNSGSVGITYQYVSKSRCVN